MIAQRIPRPQPIVTAPAPVVFKLTPPPPPAKPPARPTPRLTFVKGHRVTLDHVIRSACDEVGTGFPMPPPVTFGDVCGRGRHPLVVATREAIVYAARQLTLSSYPEIARAMGGRNHSTVITEHHRILERIKNGDMHPGSDVVTVQDFVEAVVGRAKRIAKEQR